MVSRNARLKFGALRAPFRFRESGSRLMSRGERIAYLRGGFQALNDVLNTLNTLEDKKVEKKILYQMIMDIRPKLPSEFEN